MERTGINPFKEINDSNEIIENPSELHYTKPSWMINNDVYDTIWKVAVVGIEVDYSSDLNLARTITFSKPVSENSLLTDSTNKHLLKDIQNSLLYLDTKGKITRPKRIASVLNSICHLIRHANEVNSKLNKPKIKLLSQIRFDHLKGYLLDFQVEEQVFSQALEHILGRYKSRSQIDWDEVKFKFNLSSRGFLSLKGKLIGFLEDSHQDFQATRKYKKQHQDAHRNSFDVEEHLLPSKKTISNEISKLEALFTARPAQVYKFPHSSINLFAGGELIFENMLSTQRTALIPAHVCFHAISSSLTFCRTYGEALREYFANLAIAEKTLLDSIGVGKYQHSFPSVQQGVFEKTVLPDVLKELKASCYPLKKRGEHGEVGNQLFLYKATRLYTAAIFTLLATFTSARLSSLLGLSRDCFVQSPMDGLFDIILRIPKSSERWQLEQVHRPIPDLIYDYGLEFASFSSQVEDRRGLFAEDSESFLFSRSTTPRSLTTSLLFRGTTDAKVHLQPISGDTIYDYLSEFTDWSQSPLISGRRWYPRPHQFRRFFAVLYFHFTQDSGLEELSWFMGHAGLDQTFHYAEVSPTDEWIDEAESTIAKIASSVHKPINADKEIQKIVRKARQSSSVTTVIEPLARELIEKHKAKTKQQVRFHKIDGDDVFFYFTQSEESH
ncbi:hypothetical protein V6D52_10575 [Idiomarina loihiensis]|uniref:hypothetical protein n=1 Tax=Idiomarina loihiensis TaxID=135577 RepID=UPI0039BE6D49